MKTTDGREHTTDEIVAMVRETQQIMTEAAHRLQMLTSLLRERLLENRVGGTSGG